MSDPEMSPGAEAESREGKKITPEEANFKLAQLQVAIRELISNQVVVNPALRESSDEAFEYLRRFIEQQSE